MNIKELLLLLVVPLALLVAAYYMVHMTDEVTQQAIYAKKAIPEIEALQKRIDKEGLETTQANWQSFLSKLRTLLVDNKQGNIELAQLVNEHFKLHMLLAVFWCALVFGIFYSSRKRTIGSNKQLQATQKPRA